MNKIIITGNLTADPRVNTISRNGENISVCNFTVAVNEGRGENQKTTYFNVAAWRGLAEPCSKFLTKGRKVLVEGPVSLSVSTGNDGKTYANLNITAATVEFMDSANRGNAVPAHEPNYDNAPAAEPMQVVEPDELPF